MRNFCCNLGQRQIGPQMYRFAFPVILALQLRHGWSVDCDEIWQAPAQGQSVLPHILETKMRKIIKHESHFRLHCSALHCGRVLVLSRRCLRSWWWVEEKQTIAAQHSEEIRNILCRFIVNYFLVNSLFRSRALVAAVLCKALQVHMRMLTQTIYSWNET